MNAGQQQEARGNALKWAGFTLVTAEYSAYACAYTYAYAKGHKDPDTFATSFQEARKTTWPEIISQGNELQRKADGLSQKRLGILRALGDSAYGDNAYNETEKELYAIWDRLRKLEGKLRFGQDPESMAGLDRYWLERGKG